MSQKAIKEAQKWLNKGIISEDQFQLIQAEYPTQKNLLTLLPFLSSLLIGLGALSWVLLQLINGVTLTDFYSMAGLAGLFFAIGYLFHRNDQSYAWIGMQALGLLSVGGTLMLSQGLFYPVFSHAYPLFLWALFASALVWLSRNSILYLMSIVITLLSVSFTEEQIGFLLAAVALYLISGMMYPIIQRTSWLNWFAVSGLVVYFLKFQDLVANEHDYWLFLIFAGLYVVAYFTPESMKQSYRVIGLYGMMVTGLFASLFDYQIAFWESFGVSHVLFLVILLLMFGFVIFQSKCICNLRSSTFDGLVMIPWFVWGFQEFSTQTESGNAVNFSVAILIVYAIHGILTMYLGNVRNNKTLGVIGVVQFLVMVLLLFVKLDWDWDLKFMVFVISGLLLSLIYWVAKKYKKI